MKILLRTSFFAASFILRELKDCFIVRIEFDCCLESASGLTAYKTLDKSGLAVHQKVCQLPVRQFLFSNGTPYSKPAVFILTLGDFIVDNHISALAFRARA